MNVALHGSEDNLADFFGGAAGFHQERLDLGRNGAQHFTAQHQLRNEALPGLELLADDLHRLAAGVQNFQRLGAGGQQLVHHFHRIFFAHVYHCIDQFLCHNLLPLFVGSECDRHTSGRPDQRSNMPARNALVYFRQCLSMPITSSAA